MAKCQCGEESPRIRVTYHEDGTETHECPICSPQSFERVQMPSEKKLWADYEYMPNMYRKIGDHYEAKDELRSDTEERLSRGSTDDAEAYAAALENKRRHRRTEPLTRAEIQSCMNRAEEILNVR